MNFSRKAVGIVIPLVVFVLVWTAHYLWVGFFPEQNPAQSQWVTVAAGDVTWWERYIAAQSYWLGFSYSLSMAFAAHALHRYQRDRNCAGGKLALGGITFTGFLAVAGCFLIGCCGSPMLAVYISLFGAAFMPLAKPFVAAITTVSIGASWLYLHFHRPAQCNCSEFACCSEIPAERRS